MRYLPRLSGVIRQPFYQKRGEMMKLLFCLLFGGGHGWFVWHETGLFWTSVLIGQLYFAVLQGAFRRKALFDYIEAIDDLQRQLYELNIENFGNGHKHKIEH